jgi:hypothetical protein
MMQLFADSESLKADIRAMKDSWVKWYDIKQKEYELSQIERRIKWRDYASVKTQCEQYFVDNGTLFDKNTIINETRTMLSRWQTVNEWPHLAAVFLLDHASVTNQAKQDLASVKPQPPKQDFVPNDRLSPGEAIIPPKTQYNKPPPPAAPPPPVPSPVVKSQITKTPADKSTAQSTPENVPEILTTQQKIIFKDGAYYLTGPKGNTRRVEVSGLLVNLNLPKNAPENLKKSVKMIKDFSLLLDAYIAANPKETPKHEAAIKQIQWLFAHEDIQMWKKILDVTSITGGMFDNFWRTFSNTDLKKVNDAFRIQDESARRLAILNFIRDDFGQSDIVLAKIMEKNGSYFTFPKDEEILNNGDLSAAGLSVSWRQSVEKVIRRAYLEAAGNWNKNYKEYLAQFQAQNPGVTVNEDSARKNNEQLTVLALAKREIMYQKLYNKDLQWELLLAQSIMGATTLGMSDKSWDVSKEIGWMIAMEAFAIAAGVVTAGTATVVINAAMLGRNAYRGAKALEAYNAASKTRRALTTSARILGSGAGFEAGAATTRSYIENGDLTSMHSLEGYAQSVGMMWAMSAIGKLISVGALGRGIQFKEWAGFAKNVLPFTGQVALEGTAIFGTSAVIGSVFFDRRDNWTLEQMAQAMLMATLLKGAGRVSASKNPKWEIEVQKVEVKAKEGATYTNRYIVDGKEYRWSSKQNAFLGKNGEKYTKEEFEILQKENAPVLGMGNKVSDTQKITTPEAPVQKVVEKPTQVKEATSDKAASWVKNNQTTHENNVNHSTKPKYEWKWWKTVDTVLQWDNRKLRQILPFADNNVWTGLWHLTKGEMSLRQALQNSLAWTQNQTFSQIYREMTKPWRANPSWFVKNSVDNIRTLLLSGESGKWISRDRLWKLGLVMSASAIDYVNSDEYTQEWLLNAISGGIGYTFNKYVLNPSETLKLFQEIIVWNWVAILAKESSSFIWAWTWVVSSTISTVTDRLQ